MYRQSYPNRCLVDLLRLDTMFREAIIPYLKARAAVNDHTYSYMFNMDQPIFGMLTPWHCSDIPYVFRNIELVDYPNGSPDAERCRRPCLRASWPSPERAVPNAPSFPPGPPARKKKNTPWCWTKSPAAS